MSLLSLALPGLNEFLNTAAPENNNAFTAIQTWANGGIDSTNLAAGGVNPDRLAKGITFTGAANIPGTDSRTNTAYGTLPTPDQVTGVVLPANGLIVVGYQAAWQESVIGAARAAIFLGVNQLKVADNTNAAPAVQETSLGAAAANVDKPLATNGPGLLGAGGGSTAYTGDVTTGQVVGMPSAAGPCFIFAAAGTYIVSVQFKASSGSVTAKNRKLWVAALSY